MPSYNKQTTINTYTVDKLLIENLETYLNNDVLEILNLDSEEDKKDNKIDIAVIIHDSQGIEKYVSIKEYKFLLFRNDIKGITIEYSLVAKNKELKITLRMGDTEENSDLSLSLSDENPRDKVSGIEHGILAILNQNKNLNKIFYPPQFFSTIIFLGIFISGILALNDDYSRKEKFIFSLIFWVSLSYFILPKYFKGYCSFDTNKQKELNKWFSWLVTGILGFILFTTLLTSVRRSLFGF